MTVRHELSSRQLRALLLLLVLVPLIPTVLMFRFMVEAVRSEHAAVEDQLGEIYRETLASATASLPNHLKTGARGQPASPSEIFEFYRRTLDPSVRIRITDGSGKVVASDAEPTDKPITETSLGKSLPGGRVELALTRRAAADSVDDQMRFYQWTIGAVILANLLISGAAAVGLHRQIKLHELESSSLATVAHELKTPLASMRVLIDTLLDAPSPDAGRVREFLQLMATENSRLSRLAENFLTLSRFETNPQGPGRIPIAPADLAHAAVESLDRRFRAAGVEPLVAIDDGLPMVSADREGMAIVLVNLLDNALKYSEAGQPVSLRVRSAGDRVEFVVEDHGIGIPREEQARIFDRFYQADQKLSRTREGCGLGLHIAKSIVEAHGGDITVRSAPVRGSTFGVSLPAVKQT